MYKVYFQTLSTVIYAAVILQGIMWLQTCLSEVEEKEVGVLFTLANIKFLLNTLW